MFVGVCRLTFHLHGVSSLKEKRGVMRRIIERTKVKFNASVAETEDNDKHQRGVVGVAVVGNTSAHVNAMMSSIVRFVEHLGFAEILNVATEVIPMKDDIGEISNKSMSYLAQGGSFSEDLFNDEFYSNESEEEEEDL